MPNLNNQKGISILLAILILAVVTVISFLIATLMTRELKMASTIDRSVTSYFAAESGIESALWEVRKGEGLETYRKDLTNIPGANWELTETGAEKKFEGHLDQDKSEEVFIAANSDVIRLKFTRWEQDPVPGISWLEYKLTTWPEGAVSAAQITTKEGLLDDPEGVLIDIDSSKNNIFRFKPIKGGVTYTLEPICIGIAETECTLSRKFLVTSTGTYAQVKRAIQAIFLKKAPLHGIFDYVIFSDLELIKGGGGG